MHRATPSNTSFRSYSAGGARATIDKVDDKKMMQESGGNFMKGETRDKVEAPQNYGFTSVVMPATKGKDGQIEESAEGFVSFMGGNRSFPVMTVMDDRRYRLKELENGDTAFYDHQQQQLHMNKDGTFLTGLNEKKVRLQLADVDQQQGQQGGSGGSGGATTTAETGGSTGGGQSGGQQKKQGQKSRYKKESKKFVDIHKDRIDLEHDKEIKHKAPKHTFDGDVVIKGELYVEKDIRGGKNLRINMEGFKPTGEHWAAGSAGGAPTSMEEGASPSAAPHSSGHLRVVDGGFVIDGDLTIEGNLTINGVVRAKGFETLP